MDFTIPMEALSQRFHDHYWTQRILQQLRYLTNLLRETGRDTADVEAVFFQLAEAARENGAITKQDVLRAEAALSAYHALARQERLICAAHAHIDMNWQWGMDETVGVVIDTFQTMLNLMREYPDYTFTQTQASTYEIIDKYAPSMLPEIRQRVKEGRWEVAATAWVEPDKNMLSTESQVRHILYTKAYLAQLLELDPNSLQLELEPDTFGHSRCIPDVLCHGGIQYYYHCRGNDQEELYRWQAPSGREVLVFRDPNWYHSAISYDMAAFLPSFCARHGVQTGLKVYGVGDHGGGPTRRDIERIRDMATWPLMPEITFGRMDTFFHEAARHQAQFPVVRRELNFIFTGCYTTQSRIKQANRAGEDRLYDSEALMAMARLAGCDFPAASFDRAWKNVLFNQFHDILPGSGIRETREAALGMAQETNGYCVGNANRALYAMGQKIDTSAYGVAADPNSTAEGAGVGLGTTKSTGWERAFTGSSFQVTQTSRSGGSVRAFTLFNPTQYDRCEPVELTLWDWDMPLEQTALHNSKKEPLPFAVVHENKDYWRHRFCKIAFVAQVPAFGYATCYVLPDPKPWAVTYPPEPRLHRMTDAPLVLENEHLRAVFGRSSMALLSLTDRATGKELLRAPASFRLVDEVEPASHSAWIVGACGNLTDLNEACFVEGKLLSADPIRQELAYGLKFRNSTLRVKVRLDQGSRLLRFSTEVDWHETSRPGTSIPLLQFHVPFAYEAQHFRCSIAGGYEDRPQLGHDVPALLYAAPLNPNGSSLWMTSDCKYGYRCYENALSVTLLRSPHTPDRYPEHGVNQMELGLGIAQTADWYELEQGAFCFSHPLFVYSNSLHKGSLPADGQLLKLHGRGRVVCLKEAEDGSGLLLRAYQNDPAPQPLTLNRKTAQAVETDLLERPLQELSREEDAICLNLEPWRLHSMKWICHREGEWI